MDVKTGFFYLFSVVLLFASFRVVTARNPVHAVLFLMLAFSQASVLWLLLQAEFLAMVLVLVYLGAVMVLFLFVVMMLDLDLAHLRRDFKKYLPLAMLIGVVIILELSIVLIRGFIGTSSPVNILPEVVSANNTQALGYLMFTDYLYAFEIAGIILLVAIIAAVALTLRKRKDVKGQNIAEQVAVKAKDRMRIVSMDSSNEAKQDRKSKSSETESKS